MKKKGLPYKEEDKLTVVDVIKSVEPTSSEDDDVNKLSELQRSDSITVTRVTTTRTSSEEVKSDRPSSPSSEVEDEDKIRVTKEIVIVRDVERKIPDDCDDENEEGEESITDKEEDKQTGVDVIKSVEPRSSEDDDDNKLSELHRSDFITVTRVTTTRTSSEEVKSTRPSSPSSEDEDEDKIRVTKEVVIVRDVKRKIPDDCDDENDDKEERITDKKEDKLTGVDVIKSVEPTSAEDDDVNKLSELHRSDSITVTRVTTTRTSSEGVKSDKPSSPSSEDDDKDKIRVTKEVFINSDVERKIPDDCDDENDDGEERITNKEEDKLTGFDVIKSVEPTSAEDDDVNKLSELHRSDFITVTSCHHNQNKF